MKKFLSTTLLILAAYTAGAQQVLSLDSCRALAMANNKELLISQEKINAAHYRKKAAFANYLPKLDATGAYIRNQKEISLLSDSQKDALSNIGTNLSGALQNGVQNMIAQNPGLLQNPQFVVKEYERVDFYGFLVHIVRRLMAPKSGIRRKGILVFTRFLKEAKQLTWSIPGAAIVSGDTPKAERERILEAFKRGEIPVVANVGVLTTGFDYPELDTVVMARPTMSLALYYQIVGRCIRPHPSKESAWFVDLCGNIKRFGEVKDLRLENGGNGKWAVYSNGKQLTNVRF